jgi:hypothetical protein
MNQTEHKIPAASIHPYPPAVSLPQQPAPDRGDSEFRNEFKPLDGLWSPYRVIDALLKNPTQISFELLKGKRLLTSIVLICLTVVCLISYGIIMGSFSGGRQFWVVPVKVTCGYLLSALICLPSLYILASFSGAKQKLDEIVSLLCQALAVSTLFLMGFAPIIWIFSQSTDTVKFMGILHLAVFVTAMTIALKKFGETMNNLNSKQILSINIWSVVLVIVMLQMTTTLRPLIGPFETFAAHEKKLFIQHFWNNN